MQPIPNIDDRAEKAKILAEHARYEAGLNKEQKEGLLLAQKGYNIFLTAQAGSGKSHLIKAIKNWFTDRGKIVAVTALTGVAAQLIEGVTIHRWAGIQLGELPIPDIFEKVRKSGGAKNWRECDLLIIDEISMMSPDLFDKLEAIARNIRRSQRVFGGLQVILVGDFLQLPSVKTDVLCFKAQSWSKVVSKTVYLKQNMRQNDKEFQQILSEVRLGIVTPRCEELLRRRVNAEIGSKISTQYIIELLTMIRNRAIKQPINTNTIKHNQDNDKIVKNGALAPLTTTLPLFRLFNRDVFNIVIGKLAKASKVNNPIKPTKLFPDKRSVDDINERELAKLVSEKNPIQRFKACDFIESLSKVPAQTQKDWQEICNKSCPARPILDLCIGAQVMLTYNLSVESGLVNGSRAIIIGFQEQRPLVKFMSGIELIITPQRWDVYINRYDKISRMQIPLILAWSNTVHKAQGSSMDCVEVDLGPKIFMENMFYVALSRVRSLEGLCISDLDFSRVMAHPEALEFYRQIEASQAHNEITNNGKVEQVNIIQEIKTFHTQSPLPMASFTPKLEQINNTVNRKNKVVTETAVAIQHNVSSTVQETYKLYKEGNTLAQIAEIRKIKVQTIEEHIAKCIEAGLIDAVDLLDIETINYIIDIINERCNGVVDKLKPIKEICDDGELKISYAQIKYTIAFMTRNKPRK